MSSVDDKNSSPISGIARKKVVYHAKCKLRGILTNDPFDNLRMLLAFEMKSSLDPSLTRTGKAKFTSSRCQEIQTSNSQIRSTF